MSTSTTVARICRKKIPFLSTQQLKHSRFRLTALLNFLAVLIEDLEAAQLIEDVSGKKRVLDITHTPSESPGVSSIKTEDHLKKVRQGCLDCSWRFLFCDHALC